MFLKWSDDLVASLSSKMSEVDLQVTMDAFLAFNDIHQGHHRPAS